MPTSISCVPKYRKHKATGQATVTIQGRDFYLGPHETKASKLDYDRRIGEWLAAGRPALPTPEPQQVTVAEIVMAFLKHARGYYVKHDAPARTAENLPPVHDSKHSLAFFDSGGE